MACDPAELPACPVETTAQLIGSKWRLLIMRDLLDGTKRFGELKRSLGSISQKVLTSNLREMEERGLGGRQPATRHRRHADMGRRLPATRSADAKIA